MLRSQPEFGTPPSAFPTGIGRMRVTGQFPVISARGECCLARRQFIINVTNFLSACDGILCGARIGVASRQTAETGLRTRIEMKGLVRWRRCRRLRHIPKPPQEPPLPQGLRLQRGQRWPYSGSRWSADLRSPKNGAEMNHGERGGQEQCHQLHEIEARHLWTRRATERIASNAPRSSGC